MHHLWRSIIKANKKNYLGKVRVPSTLFPLTNLDLVIADGGLEWRYPHHIFFWIEKLDLKLGTPTKWLKKFQKITKNFLKYDLIFFTEVIIYRFQGEGDGGWGRSRRSGVEGEALSSFHSYIIIFVCIHKFQVEFT